MMPRRDFIQTATSSLLAMTLSQPSLSGEGQAINQSPNVLFIFPDQFRLQAMGFWQKARYRQHLSTAADPVFTPHLDGFADQSIVLINAVAIHPVCSPFRSMLMSGAFPVQNGVEGNCRTDNPFSLKSDLECLPEAFSKAGFATGYFGKTHWMKPVEEFDKMGNWLGAGVKGTYYNRYDSYIPPGPNRHGAETWCHTVKDNHVDPSIYSNRPEMVGGLGDGQAFQPKQFSAKVESEQVIAWLKNKHGERDSQKPFFGIWSPNPPHNPYSKVEDVEKEVYEKYYMNKAAKDLLVRPNVKGEGLAKATEAVPFYNSLVTSIDQYFGNILQTLKEEGLEENTIVIFTSDHGEMMGSHGLMGKNNAFDEAYRIPFIIRWPKAMAPAICHNMIGPVDMMPTLLGLVGKAAFTPKTCRGQDLSTALLTPGSKPVSDESRPILLGDQDIRGVRTHRHTLVLDGKKGKIDNSSAVQVYDLIKDPYQINPLALADLLPAEKKFLLAELKRWLTLAEDAWVKQKKFDELLSWD